MEHAQLKKIMEVLMYMTDHPLSPKEIREILDLKSLREEEIRAAVDEIKAHYETNDSGLHVLEAAGGFQMATRPDMAAWIRRLYRDRLTVRLSQSALETLSIIAYKQPITRGEIEQIRGVEVTGVVDTLLERRLIKVVGRKESIGRPILYGTTSSFLRQFGLRHLADLPEIETIPVTNEDLKPEGEEQAQTELPLTDEENRQNDELGEPLPPLDSEEVSDDTSVVSNEEEASGEDNISTSEGDMSSSDEEEEPRTAPPAESEETPDSSAEAPLELPSDPIAESADTASEDAIDESVIPEKIES